MYYFSTLGLAPYKSGTLKWCARGFGVLITMLGYEQFQGGARNCAAYRDLSREYTIVVLSQRNTDQGVAVLLFSIVKTVNFVAPNMWRQHWKAKAKLALRFDIVR